MGPPSSVASISAAVSAGGASPVARAQRSRVARLPTTSLSWPFAGTCATDLATRRSASGWQSVASWPIRALSTAGCSASYHCSARGPESTATLWVSTGGWTKRTLESGGTTLIVPSTDTVRSSIFAYRRRATWLLRAGSSNGQSLLVARHHVGSSPTRPPAIRQPSPQPCRVCSIGPDATAPTVSSETTGF
jgi:hypothetical protein